MAGKIIKEVKRPCDCEGRPAANLYGIGTEWQCDECGAIWVIEDGHSRDPGQFWMKTIKGRR